MLQCSINVFFLIFQINGQVLYGRSHLNASAMIKSITSTKVKIILLRRPGQEYLSEMAIKPLRLPPIEHRVCIYTVICKDRSLPDIATWDWANRWALLVHGPLSSA